MRYLLLLTPHEHASQADFRKQSHEEEKRIWSLYAGDVIRAMYFQPDPVRVALVFETESEAAVRGHVGNFPMVQAGLFDIDVMQLGPWLPLTVLFGPESGA